MNKFEFLNNQEYLSIVSRGQERSIKYEKNYEIHHIVPRSLGGKDSIENLTKLTIQEHIQVHCILAELGVPYMEYALLRMLTGSQWNKLSDEHRKELFERLPNLFKYFDKTKQFLIRSRHSRSEKTTLGRKSASLRKKYIYRSEEFQEWFRSQQEKGYFLGDAVWEKAVNAYLAIMSKTLWDFPEADSSDKKDRISSRSARARERYIYHLDPEFQEWKTEQRTDGWGGWNGLVRRYLKETDKHLENYPEYPREKRDILDTERCQKAKTMHNCMRTVKLTEEFQRWFGCNCPNKCFAKIEDISAFLKSTGKNYYDYPETEKINVIPENMSKSDERIAKQKFTQSSEFKEWYNNCIVKGKHFSSKYQAVSTYLQYFNLQLPFETKVLQ